MNIIGIIPARFGSTRFEGKPLIDIQGMSMIQRVYLQCKKAKSLSHVVVATDDQRIFAHVEDFGGKVILTSPLHASGTERCNEVLSILEQTSTTSIDGVLNIQGDEPFINPTQIDELAKLLHNPEVHIATLIKKITDKTELFNSNVVKVVFNQFSQALYFSRSPIPHLRGVDQNNWLLEGSFFKHIGIYAYRSSILESIVKIEPSNLEKAESLEQLRWLSNGYKIDVAETDSESIAIDTPEDLIRVLKAYF
jgi:3-deoxy-manno-octulosonate cytidylyltransferase (CMP-KDO synthetase)